MRGFGTGRRLLVALAALVALTACGSGSKSPQAGTQPSTTATGGTAIRVLMLTATAGFRHDSIQTARTVMTGLAASTGVFTITATEDLSMISAVSLANYDVVFFALTTGELAFSADQKAALADFVSRGKGFLGAHSATDTLYDWPDYGRLVGACFNGHPWTQTASVIVEDATHPATTGLGPAFLINEEFYVFRENPRPSVQVLLRLDAASVGASGDFPLAWAHTFGEGRAYYNALGHFSATWTDPRFQQQIAGAIRWVARR